MKRLKFQILQNILIQKLHELIYQEKRPKLGKIIE